MKGINSVRFLLGIDGGGTKTEFLLTDFEKNKIRRVVLGGSNPNNAGIENTYAVLEKGIAQICEGFDYGKISVCAGIAGTKTGENHSLLNDFFSRFGFAFVGCCSDIDLALETALKGENGTVVIMGTGIVAYSNSDGKLHRAGGRGYMIDKGGSGFHFGSDALNSAFEFLDGRGGSATILGIIEEKLGKKLEDSVSELYNGGASYIASFAPVVFEAYKLGNIKASEIIDRNALEAAKVINGARRFVKNGNRKIVVCGGLCKQKEILCPFLMKYVGDGAAITFLEEPMVNGAVSLAKRLCEK